MRFVQNFTPLDFQVKNFTPSIPPNFNSFSKKKTQKISENGEIYTAGNKFYTAAGTDGMDKFHLWFAIALDELWKGSCKSKSQKMAPVPLCKGRLDMTLCLFPLQVQADA